mmetsp:Transcript_35065/g.99415  ORF Transcript_35065/g.99415 Transcript_35065/m.99415 type:complete len:83 (+) Transcript_35065:1057-1305(+)
MPEHAVGIVLCSGRPAVTAMNGGRAGGGYQGYPSPTWGSDYMQDYYGPNTGWLTAVKAIPKASPLPYICESCCKLVQNPGRR